MKTDDLMTISTAAKECGLKNNSLYMAVQKGKLKTTTIDGVKFVTRADLNEWRCGVREYARHKSFARVNFCMENELREKIVRMAERKGVSVSLLINTAIERMIAEEDK